VSEELMESNFEEETQKAKDLAISSLAVSIAAIPMSAGLLCVIGAIMGHFAMKKLQLVNNESHRGFAMAGIIVGWVSFALSLIAFFVFIIFLVGVSLTSW